MLKRRRKKGRGGSIQSQNLSLQKGSNQAKVLGVLDEPEIIQNESRNTKTSKAKDQSGQGVFLHRCRCSLDKLGNCLLLSEGLLLLLAPHVHDLPVFVHLHGVVHQAVHVDELDALLLGVEQHRRDDGQLTHLLLCVLTITGQQPWSLRERRLRVFITTSHLTN